MKSVPSRTLLICLMLLIIITLVSVLGFTFEAATAVQPQSTANNSERSAGISQTLKEISYYPAGNAWENFWQNWPDLVATGQITADLNHIYELGGNTVRIFLHPDVFGYPTPSPTYIYYFAEALTYIDNAGLQAHVNVFDCDETPWTDISGSKTWIDAIVLPYKDDSRIAIWELQNETPINDPTVQAWVTDVLPYLQAQAGNVPATLSVLNDPELLATMMTLTATNSLDIYSFHWYPTSPRAWTTALPDALERAREIIGDADLLLGEFGYNTFDVSETSQANLYQDVLYYANQYGVEHLGAWTLHDFEEGTIICGDALAPEPERFFGLYRLDGTPKPAASILSDAFHGNFPASLSPISVLNGSFEDLNPHSMNMDDWRPWDELWSSVDTFAQDCTRAHSGQCSVKVSQQGFTGQVGLYTVPSLRENLTVCQTGYLEGYVQTENLDGWVRLSISWFDKDENYLGSTSGSAMTVSNSSEWIRVSIDDLEPLANATTFEVFAQISSEDDTARVWFDDVALSHCYNHLPLVLKSH